MSQPKSDSPAAITPNPGQIEDLPIRDLTVEDPSAVKGGTGGAVQAAFNAINNMGNTMKGLGKLAGQ